MRSGSGAPSRKGCVVNGQNNLGKQKKGTDPRPCDGGILQVQTGYTGRCVYNSRFHFLAAQGEYLSIVEVKTIAVLRYWRIRLMPEWSMHDHVRLYIV